jgi:hypothetical protein
MEANIYGKTKPKRQANKPKTERAQTRERLNEINQFFPSPSLFLSIFIEN